MTSDEYSEILALAQCENCERKTPFLFPGFKFDAPPAVVRDMTLQTLNRMKLFSEPFATKRADVCLRCRPLSNLESEELTNAPRTAVRRVGRTRPAAALHRT